jgi:5-methylthioadenosine/S-adenosylhomocysteine deaminase
VAPETWVAFPRWLASSVPGEPIREDWGVAVRGALIVDVAPAGHLRRNFAGARAVELPDTLLIPGLINLHCHAAMSLLRGVGDDLPLKAWLEERIWPLEQALMCEDFVADGSALAAIEMLLGGVTTVNDMYFYPEHALTAMRAAGMRVVAGLIVVDFPSAYARDSEDYLRKGLALRDRWLNDPLCSFSLAPHAPYTVSDAALREVAVLAAELDLPVHMHLHETALEIEQSVQQHRMRPIRRLEHLGLLGPELIAVHAVHLTGDDIACLAARGVHVAHCPHSNLKLASGFAPVEAMRRAGVNVGLGTDGAASNNRLDLLAEAATAARLAKAVAGKAEAFGAAEVLHALTLGAAKALRLDQRIGSIEKGKEADLVAVSMRSVHHTPVHDPLSQLIFAAGREDVVEVWVAGQVVVSRRQPVGLGLRDAIQRVDARSAMWQNRINEVLLGRRAREAVG